MGELAVHKAKDHGVVSGVLVKRNFNCHIISARELGSECCLLYLRLVIFVILYESYFAFYTK